MSDPGMYETPEELAARAHVVTEVDIERAASIPLDQCPRRYCWWWKSLAFCWDESVAQGCCFEARRDAGCIPSDYANPQGPCKRAMTGGEFDHFEPREPHLLEDGFTEERFS